MVDNMQVITLACAQHIDQDFKPHLYHVIFSTFQLLIEATSSGVNIQKALATVNITVTRNEHGPVFGAPSYQKTIYDTTPLGDVILTVAASDNDGVRSNDQSMLRNVKLNICR